MQKLLDRFLFFLYLYTEKGILLLIKYSFFLLPFLILTLLLGQYVQQLRLYLDDTYFIRAALDEDYISNFRAYLYYYSSLRPLTILYYYKLFSIYLDSPQTAHLIPFIIHLISGLMLFVYLKINKISAGFSALISLILVVLPFSLESWGWLAASSASLAIFFFLIQLLLIDCRLSDKYKLTLIICFQSISVLIYESTIFLFMSLAYYYLKNYKAGFFQKFIKYIQLCIFFSIPSVLYILLLLLRPPMIETRYKLLNLSGLMDNWLHLVQSFLSLFNSETINVFWSNEAVSGLGLVTQTNFSLLMFLIFTASIIYLLIQKNQFIQQRISQKSQITFFLSSFILSLLPFSWQQNYLTFRLLSLPVMLLLILLTFIYSSNITGITNRIFYLTFKSLVELTTVAVIFISLFIQISMMVNYRAQYDSDDKIADEIRKDLNFYLNPEFYENQYVLLDNFPINTVNKYYFGDYMVSNFYHEWSGEYFLNIRGHGWKNYAVNVLEPAEFRSNMEKEEFINGRPAFWFSYLGNDACKMSRCLVLENYFPYGK